MKLTFKILICLSLLTVASSLFGQQTESDELFPIRQNGKWGYIDKTGRIVIEPQFSQITSRDYHFNFGWSEGLAPVRWNNGLWGYIDKMGKTIIKPQFAEAARFSGGLARVVSKENGLTGYINKTGEFVIPPRYCYSGDFGDFTEALAYVQIIPGCVFISHDTVDRRTEYGFIDKNGKMVLSKLGGASGFSEGLAPVRVKGKYGYMDKHGNMVIPPKYESAQGFFQGLAYVVIDKRVVYIDTTGRIAIDPPRGYWITCCNYSEGLATIITKDRKYGYIDRTGKISIKPRFNGAEEFSEGLAAVNIGADKSYIGGKWGYIDKTGKIVIELKFGHAEPFHGGLALVGDTFLGTTGYIDKTGKYVWKPTK